MKQTAFRMRPWSGIGIVLGAAVGLILATVVTILGAAALLASWLRASWMRPRAPRAPRAPVTIEGRYSRQ